MEEIEGKESFLKRLGEHCRKQRQSKGKSVRDVELEGNVTRGFISELENGKTNPNFYKLNLFIKALGFTTEEFFKGFW